VVHGAEPQYQSDRATVQSGSIALVDPGQTSWKLVADAKFCVTATVVSTARAGLVW
jgi:hypothetical protein